MEKLLFFAQRSALRHQCYSLGRLLKETQYLNFRGFYSLSYMGVDGYIGRRERYENQLQMNRENFIQKIKVIANSSSSIICTDDLKTYIYICNSSREELDLLYQLLAKHAKESQNSLRLVHFNFGPEVMRLFCHLNLVEEAWQCMNSNEIDSFFNQIASYTILMDMLFDAKEYQKVMDLMIRVKEMRNISAPFPRACFILAMAACYSMKSPEALEQAMSLMSDAKERGKEVGLRSFCFSAALALHLNQPKLALDILAPTQNLNFSVIRNIKCLALTRLKLYGDAVSILRNMLEIDISVQALRNTQPCLLHETLMELESSLKLNSEEEYHSEVLSMKKKFTKCGLIINETLEKVILKPIDVIQSEEIPDSKENQRSRQRAMLAAAFNQGPQRKMPHYPESRKGFIRR